MKKIKRQLIHWLGGLTEAEAKFIVKTTFKASNDIAFGRILDKMKECNGMPAEEWCKAMYEFVKSQSVTVREIHIEDDKE